MSKAFITLGISEMSTPSEVKARWRELCSIHHPDRGGNSVEFTTYRKAYNTAMAIAAAPKSCIHCLGTGRIKTTSGFNTIELSCLRCEGLGYTPMEVQHG